ncbi:hypothetical protein GCM10010911_47860 [Paenibacillus nasutitermitis]|uniref:Uncharacterized protein n=1 Tax=Paenibacillus nasutitermitis TaxID=1652958 RepID=A0A916ZAA5_9BACL|nr:hypothetical protein GCM10010911_47860 [Paenibacillus nasutitermitis]
MIAFYLKLYRSNIRNYQAIWNERLNALENNLKRMNEDEIKNKDS